ncbi:MAG: 30S ribosome-binding factor RbfA [Lentisphaeria bacterium]|nr:30S ribosome-binding factor RbfA [Lentisphaeria bacterium]
MGEVDRLTRVNELLKRELADGLEKSLLFTSNGALVSVTEVKTSVDLRNATVFISIFVPKNGSKNEIWNEIQQRRADLQKQIGRNLKFKHTPVLTFKLDERMEEGDRVLQLLNEMEENE